MIKRGPQLEQHIRSITCATHDQVLVHYTCHLGSMIMHIQCITEIIDTQLLLARLPNDTLTWIKSELLQWLKKRRATKRQILSLVGLLQHASKVVVPGRTFTTRMYSKAASIKKLHYFTKLDNPFCSDLHWWHTFISAWNGSSFLHVIAQQVPTD